MKMKFYVKTYPGFLLKGLHIAKNFKNFSLCLSCGFIFEVFMNIKCVPEVMQGISKLL